MDRILTPTGSARRAEVIAQLTVAADPRIERYWQLTAAINRWPAFPSYLPAFEWLIAALRARE